MSRGASISTEEREEMIIWCYEQMAHGSRKSDRHRDWHAKFNRHWRTCDEHCNMAKERFVEEINDIKIIHRAQSLATYKEILAGSNNYMVKLKAQERIDKLLALEELQPLRIENPEGLIKLIVSHGGTDDESGNGTTTNNQDGEDDSIGEDSARACKIQTKRERNFRDNGS